MIPERPAALSARPSRLTSVPKLGDQGAQGGGEYALDQERGGEAAEDHQAARRRAPGDAGGCRCGGGPRMSGGTLRQVETLRQQRRPSSARNAKDSASAGRPRTGTSSPPSSMPTRLPRRGRVQAHGAAALVVGGADHRREPADAKNDQPIPQSAQQHPGQETAGQAVAGGAQHADDDRQEQAGLQCQVLVQAADQRIEGQADQAVDRQ